MRKIPQATYLNADEIEQLVKQRKTDAAAMPEGQNAKLSLQKSPNYACTRQPSGGSIRGDRSAAREDHVDDLKHGHEGILDIAIDCDLIARLAVEPKKRETFARLAKDLKQLADDLAQDDADNFTIQPIASEVATPSGLIVSQESTLPLSDGRC